MDTSGKTHSASSKTYEFGARENAVIAGAARWILIFAWFAILAGVLAAVVGILTMPAGTVNLAVGALFVVLGVWFRGTAHSFSTVVSTEGNDIAHLMDALENLGSAFLAMVVFMAVALALVAVLSVIVAGAALGIPGAGG